MALGTGIGWPRSLGAITPSVHASSVVIVWICSAFKSEGPASQRANSPFRFCSAKIRATVRTCALSFGSPGSARTGHHDGQTSANTIRASSGSAEPGLERPDAGPVGPFGIVAQRPNDRDPGQDLAADRAGIGELPARLRPDHPGIDQPLFGEAVAVMAVVMGRAEKGSRGARRTSPEREPAAGHALVEPRADLEPVVAVALVVRDAARRSRPIRRARAACRQAPNRRRSRRDSRTENRTRPTPARRAACNRRAPGAASPLRHAGSAGFPAAAPSRRGRPRRSRCCRARSSACRPRSSRRSRTCRTAPRLRFSHHDDENGDAHADAVP